MLQAGNQLAKLQYSEARQLRELVATTIQSNLATQVRDEKEKQLAEEIYRNITNTDQLSEEKIEELPLF
jgi:hypothetical protein